MAGRPRKPSNLRLMEGHRGQSRPLTPDLPAPVSALVAPDGLTPDEVSAWDKHVGWVRSVGLETAVDAGSMLSMVRQFCRANAADAVIQEKGMVFERETEHGGFVITARPEVGISNAAWRAYCALAGQFGLTPASRAKFTDPGSARKAAGDFPAEMMGDATRGK